MLMTKLERLSRQLESEDLIERAAEREQLLAELPKLEAELVAISTRHNEAISRLTADIELLEAKLETACKKLADARHAKLAEYSPRDHQRTVFQSRLSGELLPVAIKNAMDHLDRLCDANRAVIDDGQAERRGRLFAWLARARKELRELALVPGDVSVAAEAILAGQP